MKRILLIYVLAGVFTVVPALSACDFQLPTTELGPDPLPDIKNAPPESASPDSAFPESTLPEMRVHPFSLRTEATSWLSALKNTPNFRNTSGTYNLEQLGGGGRVQDLSRHLNLQLTSILAALRVSGDQDLLEKVYGVMQGERATLRDTNGDGYLNWRYLPARPTENPELHGTDKHVMEEIMAHSIVAQAAYAFKLNSTLDSKYGEAASFWTDYLINHYEAKWRERTGRRSGYPIIEKPLFHPYVNNARYFHYMYKLTGDLAYRSERDRQVGVIKRQLLPDNGAFVWTHAVNESIHSRGGKMRWRYQPVGYAGEAMAPLADLGLEGVLDESTMRGLAKTLSATLLDDESESQIMASDVGGSRAASYFVPFLNKYMTLEPLDYPRGQIGTFTSRGFALLAPWDSTGEIAQKAASYHYATGGWPNAPAGVMLAHGFYP